MNSIFDLLTAEGPQVTYLDLLVDALILPGLALVSVCAGWWGVSRCGGSLRLARRTWLNGRR